MAPASVVVFFWFALRQPAQTAASSNIHHPLLMARLPAAVFPEIRAGLGEIPGTKE
jgi:hypothetical protein